MGGIFSTIKQVVDGFIADEQANKVLLASALAFLSTTIDDFVVIVFFMSRAESRLAKAAERKKVPEMTRTEHYVSIVLGVILGFTVIVSISLTGRIFSVLDMGYICLLGFIPILIGWTQAAGYFREFLESNGHGESYDAFLKKWLRCNGRGDSLLTAGGRCFCIVPPDNEPSEDNSIISDTSHNSKDKKDGQYAEVSQSESVDRSGHRGTSEVNNSLAPSKSPQNSVKSQVPSEDDIEAASSTAATQDNVVSTTTHNALHVLSEPNDVPDDDSDDSGALEEAKEEESAIKTVAKLICEWMLKPSVLEVALVMIGVGSDNVAIYMVIFATDKPHQVVITIIVFYIMLLINISLAAWLMKCKRIALCIQQYAEAVVPFVLIGLGGYILSDSVIFGRNGIVEVPPAA